jgi:hypothetical protein
VGDFFQTHLVALTQSKQSSNSRQKLAQSGHPDRKEHFVSNNLEVLKMD